MLFDQGTPCYTLYMTDYKIWLGILAATLQIGSYLVYFFGIYKGKTKPHAFTWFVGSIINVIGFAAVLVAGGGAGAWTLAVNMVLCFAIAVTGLWQGVVIYDLYDWLALSGGILGAVLWALTKNPLSAVILIALSDIISFVPTFRKAYRKPFEENAISFSMGVVVYIISLFALQTLTVTTWLYSAEIILVDAALVAFILLRRKQLKK